MLAKRPANWQGFPAHLKRSRAAQRGSLAHDRAGERRERVLVRRSSDGRDKLARHGASKQAPRPARGDGAEGRAKQHVGDDDWVPPAGFSPLSLGRVRFVNCPGAQHGGLRKDLRFFVVWQKYWPNPTRRARAERAQQHQRRAWSATSKRGSGGAPRGAGGAGASLSGGGGRSAAWPAS